VVLTSIIAQRAPRDLRAFLVPFTESRNVDTVSFFREALAASVAEILVGVYQGHGSANRKARNLIVQDCC
jgi:hypothetical protein